MSSFHPLVVRWQCCVLPVTAITFLALMPQIHLWLVRGSQWEGAYATLQGDEFLYSAYVNALIDGRPRRNDPPAGQDDSPQSPLPESLFSIQFVPPFTIAFLARTCGVSASTAFIFLLGAAGLFSSLSVFWLLTSITGDHKLAAVGVLAVLCCGTLAAGQGLFGMFLKPYATMFGGLPFLRRYLPGAPFPLFFVFCALLWQALTTASRRTATVKAVLAGTVFGILVFSYFYLWTAAIAWLACLVLLWLFLRPLDTRNATRVFTIAGTLAILALVPYFYLLSHRSPNSDRTQLLTFTHHPDLTRIPEIIGAIILVVLVMRLPRNRLSWNQPTVIFAASFALFPFVVFNQQVVTGRSLQPYHYEVFIANYATLIALVLTAKLLRLSLPRRRLVLIAFFCLLWGTIEVTVPFHAGSTSDTRDDEMVPVLLRLRQLAKDDGTWPGLCNEGKTPALVFSPQIGIIKLLPTWAPQGSLAEMGSGSFQSMSRAERKELLFAHLYYSGINPESLRALLNGSGKDSVMAYFARSTVFGPDRMLPPLVQNFQPIQPDEIEREVNAYEIFTNSFSREKVVKRRISYVVTPAASTADFSHIDPWYERDAGERVGAYDLYRLRLRE